METYKGKGVQDKREVKHSVARQVGARSSAKVGEVATKVVKVAHDKCGDTHLDYALFPIGFKYNEELQALRKGDIIRLLDGSKHCIRGVVRISLKSAVAEYLCWMRYGFGIARAVELWNERVRLQRLNVKVISDSECLVLFFDKEKVKYEEKRVR